MPVGSGEAVGLDQVLALISFWRSVAPFPPLQHAPTPLSLLVACTAMDCKLYVLVSR